MPNKLHVSVSTQSTLAPTSCREGETKVGQGVKLLSATDENSFARSLVEATKSGARYALLGIAEDIGPRANLGREGADKSWNAFLQFFLNMQSNRFFDASKILLVGEIDLNELKLSEKQKAEATGNASVSDLRELCAKLDERVHPVIQQIVMAGLEPIVIGGGNNNSYPTIKGVVEALREIQNNSGLTAAVVNCDPHADFRMITDGRHSGNPFTFANRDGLLSAYCVLGAHENYNSAEMLERMDQCSYPLFFWDEVIRGEKTWEEQVNRVIDYLSQAKAITGLELDLDGIKNLPSSAKAPFGITEEQAFYFIYRIASTLDTKYLHLSEAAPSYGEDGVRTVGKVLAKIVVEYVFAREQYRAAKRQLESAIAATAAIA